MRLFEIQIVPIKGAPKTLIGWTVFLRNDEQPTKIEIDGLVVGRVEVDGKIWSCFSCQVWQQILNVHELVCAQEGFPLEMQRAISTIVPRTPVDRVTGFAKHDTGLHYDYEWYYHNPGMQLESAVTRRRIETC